MPRFSHRPGAEPVRVFVANKFFFSRVPLQRPSQAVREDHKVAQRNLPRPISIDGRPARCDPWNLHGFQFNAIALDLADEIRITVG
jgi:hypothetical protein